MKAFMFCLYMGAYSILYIYPNFHPLLPPRVLPLSGVDTALPFIPWTFLIYVSIYVLFMVAITTIKEAETFYALCRMCFLGMIICGTIFYIFPTVYPRPVYPHDSTPLVAWILGMVTVADAPTNCFPSMHVAMAGITAWAIRLKGTRLFLIFSIWSALISLSTMTTKQHYFLDVVGGLSVVVLVAALETFVLSTVNYRRWLPDRPLARGFFGRLR